MNHFGSSVKADQGSYVGKCICKPTAEYISSFGKRQLRDVGEEVVFNVIFSWFSPGGGRGWYLWFLAEISEKEIHMF